MSLISQMLLEADGLLEVKGFEILVFIVSFETDNGFGHGHSHRLNDCDNPVLNSDLESECEL